MSSNRPCQHGFTLVELLIFIVVVGVGLTGILQVVNTVVTSSADPVVHKQAMAIAESILEEIMLKEYVNPVGGYDVATPNAVATDRALFDDVDDYKSRTATEIQLLFTDTLAQVPGYTIAIVVGNEAALSGVAATKKITVTVSKGSDSVSLSSYRANFCPAPASVSFP